MYKTMDANEAVSMVSYKFSEVCGIYPITPSSPMAENIDKMASKGEVNYFGNPVKVVEMQSEAGAAGLVHGALQSGVLASTFTASQGLLLMIPSLYKMAGEMLPGVLHVAARSLSTQSLSIFGDHQDVYACRQTGCCMISSTSVTEAYHMAMVTHLASIKSSLPFINFFDGFRTSHEINKVKLVDMDKIRELVDEEALLKFRNKAMRISSPNTRGTAENEDIYFQHMEARNVDYDNAVENVNYYMKKINKLAGTNYKPFNYYGAGDATDVIIAMGSVCETIKETIEYLNGKGEKLGLVVVHLYRPFNASYLKKVLPRSVKNIAVLDRTKEAGSSGEPLYLDVVAALNDTDIRIVGGRYGLSSKNTTPAMIKGVYDFLDSKYMKHNFTVGIDDDVTRLSIRYDKKFYVPNNDISFLIYGYGSDGMVSTSKDIIKIIGDNTRKFVQGYFQYDSKKSGGVTRSHIRISDSPIKSAYYVDNPSLVVVSKDSYIYKYDVLDNIKKNGTLILNTNLSDEDLLRSLPNKIKYLMASKNITLYVIDAYNLVNKLGLKNKISTCMEMCIFNVIKIMGDKKVSSIMKKNNEVRFAHKGNKVIEVNNNIVDKAVSGLRKLVIPKDEWINLVYIENEDLGMQDKINLLQGDDLPVSAFLNYKDGVFEAGTTKNDKRDVAENVPCWISENCIQCNQCVSVCPHAVIRSYLLEEDKGEDLSVSSLFPKDKKYAIGISYKDCTGCGVCASVCPGKAGNKALTMKKNDRDKYRQETFEYLEKNNVNDSFVSPVKNVKSLGFIEPRFEFSGACAGCGETAYLKNLTQMFGKNLMIANATGCSSIYSASMPSNAYSVPWASSLFEDNSEYGLGILTGYNVNRERIKKYMLDNLKKDKKLFEKWLSNSDDYDICKEVSLEIDYSKHNYLKNLKDYLLPCSMWIVGGDGFAYDIGYGGLDHVLSRRDNINILVLDTEVYSNTGGQSSKSSNFGSIASFTSLGKDNYKKDLARIAMCYPHVYVACVNMGYNKEHYLKVLEEANSYKGPSLIIAYSTCIEHGIKAGMEHSVENALLASKCGYFLTFRYNPITEKFSLDSKDVDFDLYEEFLMTETRYANLKKVNKKEAKELLEKQKEWAMKRYEYYKKL